MSVRIHLLAAALCAALSAVPLFALAAPQAEAGAPLAEPSRSLYWQGHEALGQSDWRQALEHFRALERELAQSKTEPSDAAIYWQAYALAQARRTREAAAEVDRLRAAYPESVWLDDAQALVSRQPESLQEPVQQDAGAGRDAEALMALDALLSSGSAKSVPLLQRVLAGSHSDRVKGRAMFVLSQVDPAAADAAVDAIIRGDGSARLKSEAIRMIAAGGRASSLDRLLPLYRGSADKAVRRGVLDAFVIGDRADLMLQLIEGEDDASRRHDAIERLGAMGHEAELGKLYALRKDPQDRRAVLRALGVAGAGETLAGFARSETDPVVKAEAIRALGMAGGKDAVATLGALYAPGQPESVRKAVIQGLMIAGATREMVGLYRKETDPKLRRQLLGQITASDPDAALELIDEALEQRK